MTDTSNPHYHKRAYWDALLSNEGPQSQGSTDAMDQGTLITLDEYEQAAGPDALHLAGIDALTPVDTFISMQGNTSYVTYS
jgi:hypothetical protein